MAQEMGKPITQGRAEVEKCALACQHFAEHAERYLADEPVVRGRGARVASAINRSGLILAVMPWNFPLWQVIRCAVPALMAGNVVVLKHASNVTGCALALDFAAQAATLPAGILPNPAGGFRRTPARPRPSRRARGGTHREHGGGAGPGGGSGATPAQNGARTRGQ